MTMTTNYRNTFILVSPDSTAATGRVPPRPGSVVEIQYHLLAAAPYRHTSDDVLFLTHARRSGIPEEAWPVEREAFLATPRACLRASPLVKTYGWGLHHDADGRVALYGVETEGYRRLSQQAGIRTVSGMRSRRA